MGIDDIEAEVLKLNPQARARLAKKLLESLEALSDEENATRLIGAYSPSRLPPKRERYSVERFGAGFSADFHTRSCTGSRRVASGFSP